MQINRDSKGRQSFGRAQGRRVKVGKLRAADGKIGYERRNRFPVRCNFARQNCVKISAGVQVKNLRAITGCASFEFSKLEADGELVMSFKSHSSVRHSLEKKV